MSGSGFSEQSKRILFQMWLYALLNFTNQVFSTDHCLQLTGFAFENNTRQSIKGHETKFHPSEFFIYLVFGNEL